MKLTWILSLAIALTVVAIAQQNYDAIPGKNGRTTEEYKPRTITLAPCYPIGSVNGVQSTVCVNDPAQIPTAAALARQNAQSKDDCEKWYQRMKKAADYVDRSITTNVNWDSSGYTVTTNIAMNGFASVYVACREHSK